MTKENKIYKAQMVNYIAGLNISIRSLTLEINHNKKQLELTKKAKAIAIKDLKSIK